MRNLQINISRSIRGLISQYNLGYVLNNLENIITLPIPYKHSRITNEQYEQNKKISIESISTAESTYTSLLVEYDKRKEIFDYLKEKHSDFCSGISNTLSREEGKEYLYLLKNCIRRISILVDSFKIGGNDYQKSLLEKKDSISSIIDSEDIARLTYMQDKYVLDELNSIDYSNIKPEMLEKIETLKSELTGRLTKYNEFKKLYSSNNQIRLKLSRPILPSTDTNDYYKYERE